MLYIDIETRSVMDLRKVGVYVYAQHPTTDITVFCYALGDGPVQTWLPLADWFMPIDLERWLADETIPICAHNAGFERTMLRGPTGAYLLGDRISQALASPERWVCTAARAAWMGLPRSLEGASEALGLSARKDKDGHRLMLKLCKPKPGTGIENPVWPGTDAEMTRLGIYCAQDVEVERALHRVMPEMPDFERQVWLATERLNDTGIMVDRDLLLATADVVAAATDDVNARIASLTDGMVSKVTKNADLTEWLNGRGIPEPVDSVAKAALEALMQRDDLDEKTREVIALRQHGGKSSASKYRAVALRINADARLRGALVYCGAASTARFSSRGAQLQNLPRARLTENPENALAAIDIILKPASVETKLAELKTLGPPIVLASELLRPNFIARADCWFVRGDYSQIEARVTPWLAGSNKLISAFEAYDAGTGPDLYIITASDVYRRPADSITKADRQAGKVTALSMGFGGGQGALQAMAKAYGLKIPEWVPPLKTLVDPTSGRSRRVIDRSVEPTIGTDEWIKRQWREANPEIVQYWRDLEDKAVACMMGATGIRHRINTHTNSYFVRNNKCMMLVKPSGLPIFYWNPRLVRNLMPWEDREGNPVYRVGVRYTSENAMTKQWQEFALYGGLICENCVGAETEVLTRRGWTRIVDVLPDDMLWDGVEWVRHCGVLAKGEPDVISFGGIKITPEHKVLTETGWVVAEHACHVSAVRACERYNRAAVSNAGGGDRSGIGEMPGEHAVCAPGSRTQVYDILNAGPRHRFTVRGDDGRPFIVANCTQSVARDIMADAMLRFNTLRGCRSVMTVHDELLGEISKSVAPTAQAAAAILTEVMSQKPGWAAGLPIAAEASAHQRYLKIGD